MFVEVARLGVYSLGVYSQERQLLVVMTDVLTASAEVILRVEMFLVRFSKCFWYGFFQF